MTHTLQTHYGKLTQRQTLLKDFLRVFKCKVTKDKGMLVKNCQTNEARKLFEIFQ